MERAGGPDEPLEATFTPSSSEGREGPAEARPPKGAPSPIDDEEPPSFAGRLFGGRWRVLDRIGIGGMAVVHAGEDLRLGRKVAIKILHAHISDSREARARLAREARAIAQVRHENVIEVYDYAADEAGATWLVTELLEGGSLRQHLERHPRLAPELAAMVTIELLRALREAHGAGIVHRDVKPDNILLDRKGRLRLSDFGIAQIVGEQKMTMTGALVGSPSFMSPEQAEARPTDHRTDLFSAAIVLYRMITGELPFRGSNAIETLRNVAGLRVVDLVNLAPDTPAPIAEVVRRAFRADLEERYASADEMIEDLEAALSPGQHPAEEVVRYFRDPARYTPRAPREPPAVAPRPDARPPPVSPPEPPRAAPRRAATIAVLVAAAGVAAFAALLAPTMRPREPGPEPAATAPAEAPRAEAPEPAPRPPIEARVEVPEPAAMAPRPPVEAPPLVAPPVAEPSRIAASPGREAPTPGPKRPPRAAKPRAPEVSAEVPSPAPAPEARAEPQAEPPPPPAPSTGLLQVGASRWVDLAIDGAPLGRAPDQTRYEVPTGEHRLRATNPHCLPVEKVVTIRAAETTRVRIDLTCP